ncbi:MAG: hypothetical protein JW395_2234 [Nitrospira sp.]|nr:hypothetical protein [Nitrospira sp.]
MRRIMRLIDALQRLCSFQTVSTEGFTPKWTDPQIATLETSTRGTVRGERNGTSFGLNDVEALLTVARDAKEWIAAHVLKR